MLQSEFDYRRDVLNKTCEEIMAKKRPDYAYTSEDVLSNFRRTAERAGTTPGVAWAVFFLKHVDSIVKAMTKGGESSEPLNERFADCRNYLDLGFAIWGEEQAVPVEEKPRVYAPSLKKALLDEVTKRLQERDAPFGPSATAWPPQWVPPNTAELQHTNCNCTMCERDRMASVPRTTFVTGMSEAGDPNARERAEHATWLDERDKRVHTCIGGDGGTPNRRCYACEWPQSGGE